MTRVEVLALRLFTLDGVVRMPGALFWMSEPKARWHILQGDVERVNPPAPPPEEQASDPDAA